MGEAEHPTASPIPPTPPHLACRYSALEFVAALILSRPSEEGRALLHHAVAEAGLPDHLRERLELQIHEGLQQGLTFNPMLSHSQQVALLLVGMSAGFRRNDAAMLALARTYRMTDAAVAYVERFAQAFLASSPAHLATRALNPPDEFVALAGEITLRLRLGASCGRCVAHVPPSAYEHPTDRAALAAVRSLPGFDVFMRKVSQWSVERQQHVVATGSKIRVTRKQLPEVYALWQIALERAGMSDEPGLYVDASGMNAVTRGSGHKQVIVGSSLVSLLEPAELLFCMGHELGHIRSDHVFYRWMTEKLREITEMVGAVTGLAAMAIGSLRLPLLEWYRKSELTADRFGLLVGQDLEAAGRTLMKLAGAPPAYFRKMDWRTFAAQGSEVNVEDGATDRFWSLVAGAGETHPWPAVRAASLLAWAEGGDYERLMAIDPAAVESAAASARAMQAAMAGQPVAPHQPPASTACAACRSCGYQLEAGQRFCDACGAAQG